MREVVLARPVLQARGLHLLRGVLVLEEADALDGQVDRDPDLGLRVRLVEVQLGRLGHVDADPGVVREAAAELLHAGRLPHGLEVVVEGRLCCDEFYSSPGPPCFDFELQTVRSPLYRSRF